MRMYTFGMEGNNPFSNPGGRGMKCEEKDLPAPVEDILATGYMSGNYTFIVYDDIRVPHDQTRPGYTVEHELKIYCQNGAAVVFIVDKEKQFIMTYFDDSQPLTGVMYEVDQCDNDSQNVCFEIEPLVEIARIFTTSEPWEVREQKLQSLPFIRTI